MSKEPSAPNPINRRTAIMGALLALVPASAVALATFTPRGPASGLLELIAAHKAAWEQRQQSLAEVTRIEALPAYPELPRVVIGTNGNDALFAFSESDLVAHAAAVGGFMRHKDPDAARAAWVEKKKRELAGVTEQYQTALAHIGALAAGQAYDDACDREEKARIDLIVFRPTTGEEARTMVRYLSMTEPPAEGWWAGRSEAQTTSDLSPDFARIG